LGDGVYTIEATSYGSDETGAYRLALIRACPLRFTQEPALIPAAGGDGLVRVAAPPACPWSVKSFADWLTLGSGGGVGNGTINFTAVANPTIAYDNGAMPREGQLSFSTTNGGFSFFNVRQAYNCGYRVGPKSLTIKPADVIYDSPVFTQLFVGTGNNCQWTATSNAPWLEFYEKGSSYTATGGQTVIIKATSLKFGNTPRAGSLTLAGATVNVTVEPVGQLCPAGNLTIGQTVSDSLSPDCRSINGVSNFVKQYKFQGLAGQRVAVAVSSLDVGVGLWLKRMEGDDTILAARLTPQINFESPIPGTLRMPETGYITLPADGAYFLEVFSSSFPARAGSFILSALEAPNGSCDFSVSTNSQNLTAGGGRGAVSVIATGGNCAWTATTTTSWIRLAAAGGNGSGSLEYSVETNSGGVPSGALIVAGRPFVIS